MVRQLPPFLCYSLCNIKKLVYNYSISNKGRNDFMSNVYVLVGAPGVGKSTWVTNHMTKHDLVLESDAVRMELYGELNQSDPSKVFRVMNKRLKEAIKSGSYISIFYDATNTNRRRRAALYRECKSWGAKTVHTVFILEPLSTIMIRNTQRPTYKQVDEECILKYYKSIQAPRVGVDCDSIIVKGSFVDFASEIAEHIDEPHYSPYHAETIREHIQLAINNANSDILKEVAKFHDLGKSVCRTDDDDNSIHSNYIREQLGRFCRYKNHEFVSAMYYLAYMNDNNLLDNDRSHQILETIYQHMNAHQVISKKQIKRNKLSESDLELIRQFQRVDTISKVIDNELHSTFFKLREDSRKNR